jgi:hypothetical protein
MPKQKINEMLDESKLTELEKETILGSTDMQNAYINIVFDRDLNEAHRKVSDFNNYIIYNKIFMTSDLYNKFNEADKILFDAILDRKYGSESDDRHLNNRLKLTAHLADFVSARSLA